MGEIGKWTYAGGLKMDETESKFKKRHNLDGLTFLSAITVMILKTNKSLLNFTKNSF